MQRRVRPGHVYRMLTVYVATRYALSRSRHDAQGDQHGEAPDALFIPAQPAPPASKFTDSFHCAAQSARIHSFSRSASISIK